MSDQENYNTEQSSRSDEDLNFGLQVLSFCIPLAGAIIYFVYQQSAPRKAKTACIAALIGLGVGIVVRVILVVLSHGR